MSRTDPVIGERVYHFNKPGLSGVVEDIRWHTPSGMEPRLCVFVSFSDGYRGCWDLEAFWHWFSTGWGQ
jgi:hypothetical protein